MKTRRRVAEMCPACGHPLGNHRAIDDTLLDRESSVFIYLCCDVPIPVPSEHTRRRRLCGCFYYSTRRYDTRDGGHP